MIKIIYRSLITIITLLLFTLAYLSIFGVKTNKFNTKIISQFKQVEPDLEVKLYDVSLKLNPFNLSVNAKTIGTDIVYKDKIIEIESIKSKISLTSLVKSKFAINKISISTKSLAIKDLISFIRLFNNDPKLFIAEQFINSGYLVADLELEFDESGNIKNNYKLNGLVKDGRINIIKSFDLNKIDFIFEINKKDLRFKDVKLFLNNKNISLPELVALKQNKEFLISGKLNNKKTILTKNEIKNLINNDLSELDFKEITFSSKNNFNFTINKKLKIKKLDIKSNIDLDNLKIQNSLELKNIFPQIKKNIILKNQKIKLKYEKDNLNIDGEGSVLIQNEIDKIKYKISSIKDEIKYNIDYVILKNPFELDLINYKKDIDSDLQLNFQVKQNVNEKLRIFNISLKEKNNFINIQNLALSNNNKINDVRNININYTDKENLINNIKITKKDKDYLISGHSFNIDSIIEKLLSSENELKLDILDKDIKLIIDIDKIYLDKNNITNDLNGFFIIINNEISELNLESNFSNQKNIKLTIKNNGEEKITTLFSYEAKPLVSRYKFIKGFEEGELDFYSTKKNGTTKSILKIDNFKIQEIPVLAKLLTLASLQGIADLLTGEGIRFTDFEMKFLNKDKLMTIEELYAIGPAISILMDGYIESNKLISLRGTLVPATTVNRTISSIPIIGDILVGKKIGEGVFGVSFKIKGPPKNLQTTVNPIKTLTPRFITRTLEKIKKN